MVRRLSRGKNQGWNLVGSPGTQSEALQFFGLHQMKMIAPLVLLWFPKEAPEGWVPPPCPVTVSQPEA